MPDQRFDFLEMFRRSIADMVGLRPWPLLCLFLIPPGTQVQTQSSLFKKVPVNLQPSTFNLQPGIKDADKHLEGVAEFELLEEAKDIEDEIHIIRDINKQ